MGNSILLYRYLDANAALKSIEARRFKVGRVKNFNDPFEWRMGFTGIALGKETQADACCDHIRDGLDFKFGVICFSDTVAEPVLWSHYADKHRGVAFEVECLNEPEKLVKIQYSNDRPVIDPNRFNDADSGEGYMRRKVELMICQKSAGWAYEREYRQWIDLARCETEGELYFLRIPDDFLMRVILGFVCPLEEGYIQKALEKVGLKNAKVVRARRDQETYRISC